MRYNSRPVLDDLLCKCPRYIEDYVWYIIKAANYNVPHINL